MKVAVSGANGFVGRALTTRLERGGHEVRRLVRVQSAPDEIAVGNLSIAPTGLDVALRRVSTVVHLAARAHTMNGISVDSCAAFNASNVEGTRRLAVAAVAAGVERFVFVSTVKVHGETTAIGEPFRASDALVPKDPYADSKAEAEALLAGFARDFEVVIVRPPLVYGPGVKANFHMLTESVRRGIPLPVGRIVNARSLVGIDNLCSLLNVVAVHPAAAGQAFLVSDGPPVSTPQLVAAIARAMGRKALMVPVPVLALRLAGAAVGRGALVERLCSSLAVDIDDTCRILSWQPKLSLEAGLRSMLAIGRST